MRVDYTSAVALALEKAQTWARAERAAQVMARHLLQGLLHEEEGRGHRSASVSLNVLWIELSAEAESPARAVSCTEELGCEAGEITVTLKAARIQSAAA